MRSKEHQWRLKRPGHQSVITGAEMMPMGPMMNSTVIQLICAW